MKAGALQGINSALREYTVPLTTIQQSLGVSTWALALPLALLTAFLVAKFVRVEAAQPKIAQLAAKKTGLAHLLAEKPWHVYTTGGDRWCARRHRMASFCCDGPQRWFGNHNT